MSFKKDELLDPVYIFSK